VQASLPRVEAGRASAWVVGEGSKPGEGVHGTFAQMVSFPSATETLVTGECRIYEMKWTLREIKYLGTFFFRNLFELTG